MIAQHVEIDDSDQRSPECHRCDDTGWKPRHDDDGNQLGVTRCECRKRRFISKLKEEIPVKFREESIATFEPRDPEQARAKDAIIKNPAGSFYIYGDYGRGKTHLLYGQYLMLLDHGIRCQVRTMEALIDELIRHDIKDRPSPIFDFLADIDKPFHLLIDDVDKMPDRTDFRAEVLYKLINKLYTNQRSLSVTSNFSLDDLQTHERMTPASISRVERMCTLVDVGTERGYDRDA